MQVARHWRLKTQRYRLEGAACRRCGLPTFPPRPICPVCAAHHSIDSAPTPAQMLFSAGLQRLPLDSLNLQTVP
jgi:hypothetical protein